MDLDEGGLLSLQQGKLWYGVLRRRVALSKCAQTQLKRRMPSPWARCTCRSGPRFSDGTCDI